MNGFAMKFLALALLAAPEQPTPLEGFQTFDRALVQQFREAQGEHARALQEAETDAERERLRASAPTPESFARERAGSFIKLAQTDPHRPEATYGLIWLVLYARKLPQAAQAAEILATQHVESDRLEALCWQLTLSGGAPAFEPAAPLLRAIIERSPQRTTRGFACLALALHLKNRAEEIDTLRQSVGDKVSRRGVRMKESLERELGENAVRQLTESDPDRLTREAQEVLERISSEYQDVKSLSMGLDDDGKPYFPPLGDLARRYLNQVRNETVGRRRDLSIGAAAPEISGAEVSGRPMKLSDYRGKVVVLDFWSVTCAPCMAMKPHEKGVFARLAGKPFALLGINVGDAQGQVKDVLNKQGITWPNWWDKDGEITGQWQVYAVPMTYVIDPAGVIRYKDVRGNELDEAVDSLLREMEGER